jgi:phosphoglycerate dehydrogenase-like enzyme
MKAAFLWKVPDQVRDVFLSALPGWTLTFPENRFDDPALVADADAAVGWRISEAQLGAAPRLKLFQTPAAGPEWHVPLFRKFPHVACCNSHGNARIVAEGAFALLLAQAKQIGLHDRAMRAGEWRLWREERPSLRLEGKALGLVGFGAINRRVGELGRAFGMRVRAVRRGGGAEEGLEWCGGPGDLKRLLAESDGVVVAVPLTPETRGMLGRDVLSAARPGSILVNVARGDVVDQEALWDALTDGPLGGAGIDVWYDYDPKPDAQGRRFPFSRPFHTLPNVTLSPHRTASPLDDPGRWDDIVENLRRLERGKEPLNRIDLERGY